MGNYGALTLTKNPAATVTPEFAISLLVEAAN